MRRLQERRGNSRRFASAPLAGPHLQSLFAPETLHPFAVDFLAFAPQSIPGFAEAPTPTLLGKGA
jgi:hypothetical protein